MLAHTHFAKSLKNVRGKKRTLGVKEGVQGLSVWLRVRLT